MKQTNDAARWWANPLISSHLFSTHFYSHLFHTSDVVTMPAVIVDRCGLETAVILPALVADTRLGELKVRES